MISKLLILMFIVISVAVVPAFADQERIDKLQTQIHKHQDRILVLEDKKNSPNPAANLDERIQRLHDKITDKQAIIDRLTGAIADTAIPEPVIEESSDVTPPTVLSIGTTSTTTIDLILSEDITVSAAPGDFVLSGDISTTPTVNAIAANGDRVTLSLSGALDSNDVINLAYTKRTGSIDDTAYPSFIDSFSAASQTSYPFGLTFSTNGDRMFVVGINDSQDVNQYALSTPFDVSTAIFIDSFSVESQDTLPFGLAFSADGAKMFVTGNDGNDVNEYALTTPFDVSTAIFIDSFSVESQDTTPTGLAFSADGDKMFVTGSDDNDVNEYTLSTPFDVSTASFVDSFSVASQEVRPRGLAFSADGSKMFVTGNDGQDVNVYTLSTPFDVSTAAFAGSFSVASEDTLPTDLAFSADGAKMFVVGYSANDVNEYVLAKPFSLLPNSLASFAASPVTNNIAPAISEPVPEPESVPDTTITEPAYTLPVTSMINTWLKQLDTTITEPAYTPFDVSNADEVGGFAFSLESHMEFPEGLAFSTDGDKMFVVDKSGVHEHTLSTPFNVSTAVHEDYFSTAPQETSPTGLAFSTDGTRMFVVGYDSDNVNEYTLSTPFDVSTASFVDSFSARAQDEGSTDLAFSTDGDKMFVVGAVEDEVNEYTLSTPFDVSTASFVDSFSVASQESDPAGLAFSADGAKMFVVGTNGDDVHEYTLTTPFDVSTASFVDSFSVESYTNSLTGLAFSTDGDKMFVVDRKYDNVSQYDLTPGSQIQRIQDMERVVREEGIRIDKRLSHIAEMRSELMARYQ